MERKIWWALVNMTVWSVSSGSGEGQFVGTGECGVMCYFERLWRGTLCGNWGMWRYVLHRASMMRYSWWDLVNVALWAVTCGYVDGHLVGTFKCGGMG